MSFAMPSFRSLLIIHLAFWIDPAAGDPAAGNNNPTRRLVSDIRPGPEGSGLKSLLEFGSGEHQDDCWDWPPAKLAFFFADDGVHGMEPWASDGETAWLLKDIYPGPESSEPEKQDIKAWPFQSKGMVVFNARSKKYQESMYATDGTPEGTVPLVENIGMGWSIWYSELNGYLFFAFDDRIWKTDGSPGGTTEIETPDEFNVDYLQGFKDHLYIGSYQGVWKTDGTAPLRLIYEGPAAREMKMYVLNDKIYFDVEHEGVNREVIAVLDTEDNIEFFYPDLPFGCNLWGIYDNSPEGKIFVDGYCRLPEYTDEEIKLDYIYDSRGEIYDTRGVLFELDGNDLRPFNATVEGHEYLPVRGYDGEYLSWPGSSLYWEMPGQLWINEHDSSVYVYDVPTGSLRNILDGTRAFRGVQYLSDGRYIIRNYDEDQEGFAILDGTSVEAVYTYDNTIPDPDSTDEWPPVYGGFTDLFVGLEGTTNTVLFPSWSEETGVELYRIDFPPRVSSAGPNLEEVTNDSSSTEGGDTNSACTNSEDYRWSDWVCDFIDVTQRRRNFFCPLSFLGGTYADHCPCECNID